MKSLRGAVVAVLLVLAAALQAQTFRVSAAVWNPKGGPAMFPVGVVAARDGGGYVVDDLFGLQLTKYDSAGRFQWVRRLGFDGFNPGYWPYDRTEIMKPLRVAEGSTGVYVLGSAPRLFNGGGQAYLAKYDFAGNRIGLRFLTSGGSTPRQLLLDNADNAYAAFTSGFNPEKPYLTKLNPSLNTLWQVQLDYAVTQMRLDAAGNLMLHSSYLVSGAASVAAVQRVSPAGLPAWSYLPPQQAWDFRSGDFDVLPDGSSLLLVSNPDEGHTLLHKLSPLGELVWTKPLAGYFSNVEHDAGGYLYVGSPSTVKLDPSGNVVWTRSLPGQFHKESNGTLSLVDIQSVSPDEIAYTTFVTKRDLNGSVLWNASFPGKTLVSSAMSGDLMLVGQESTRRITSSNVVRWTATNVLNENSRSAAMTGTVSRAGKTFLWGDAPNPQDAPNRRIGRLGSIYPGGGLAFDVDGTGALNPSGESLGRPTYIAPTADGGFVTDFRRAGLRKYDALGKLLWEVTTGDYLRQACLDSSGNIYVHYTLSETSALGGVAKYTQSGASVWKLPLPLPALQAKFEDPDLGDNPNIIPDGLGNVVLFANKTIWKISPSGSILWRSPIPDFDFGYTFNYDLDAGADGSVVFTSCRYSTGSTIGWVTKYAASDGRRVFDTELPMGDNSPTFGTVLYKGKVYSVGRTRMQEIIRMAIFCVDGQTGQIEWAVSPNPGLHSGAEWIFADPATDELRVAGWRYSPATAYDFVLLGMTPSGAVKRTAVYDAGWGVNDIPDGAGADVQGNVYAFGRSMGPSGTYDYKVVKFSTPPDDWARIELPALPTKMASGATYGGTVKVVNVGTSTWTAAAGYKLACVQGTAWSLPSVPLGPEDAIAPGESKVFAFTVRAPATAGAYPITFKMERNGSQFDDASPSVGVSVLAQTNYGSFVGQSVPTSMVAGQSYSVSLQYKNTGTNTWTPANGYKLQSMNPLNNTTWFVNRIPLVTPSVPPGAVGTFAGTVVPPKTSGTYNFQWQPMQETTGLAFAQASPNVAVAVNVAADAARFISRTGAVAVAAGSDFWITNTMLNVGSNTWTAVGGYRLVSLNPLNNATWGRSSFPLPATTAPGAQVQFAGACTAPLTPGAYTMQWQMAKGHAAFGDKTHLLNINVVQGPDNAQFVNQSPVPANLGPGATFNVTFQMKNLGTATWNSTYTLAPMGNSFGVDGIVSASVAPGATGTFTATLTAPTVPGSYAFKWRMKHGSTFFGEATPYLVIRVQPDASAYVSRTGPLTVGAGQDFWVSYTMKNTGSTTWSGATGYAMAILNPLNNTVWGRNRLWLAADVPPGGQTTLTGLCTAPIATGTYGMQWSMAKSGTPFGEATPPIALNVVQSPDNAAYVASTPIPTTIARGGTFTVNLTMQNVGTATWTNAYSLVPVGSITWGIAGLPSRTVAPGAQNTFAATFTAPATPGKYTFQMRMSHNGTKFGQPTPLITITVT